MEKEKYCLYRHTRKTDGGIFYIGIGGLKRPKSKVSRNKYWRNIVNKHDYDVTILVEDISWERACELEILMIAFYGRKDLKLGNLCNLTDGGEGSTNFKHSKEDKEKMSKDRKGVPANPVRVEKMRQTNLAKGENHHMKRPEMRQLTSERKKKENRDYMKGDNNPAKRPEVREKLSMGNNPAARIVMDIKTGIYYECAKEVALLYNIKPTKLRRCLRNEIRNKTSLRYV
mgnify:FL=1